MLFLNLLLSSLFSFPSLFLLFFFSIWKNCLTLTNFHYPLFWATLSLRLARYSIVEVTAWKAFNSWAVNSNMWIVTIDLWIKFWICSGSIFSPGFQLAYGFYNFSPYFTTEISFLGILLMGNKKRRYGIQDSVSCRWPRFSQVLSSNISGLKNTRPVDLKVSRIKVGLNVWV